MTRDRRVQSSAAVSGAILREASLDPGLNWDYSHRHRQSFSSSQPVNTRCRRSRSELGSWPPPRRPREPSAAAYIAVMQYIAGGAPLLRGVAGHRDGWAPGRRGTGTVGRFNFHVYVLSREGASTAAQGATYPPPPRDAHACPTLHPFTPRHHAHVSDA